MGEWFGQFAWLIWLVLAAGLAVAEMLTLDLTLLMLAAGALAGGVVALALPGLFWAQILVAVVVALAMLGFLRPSLLRRLRAASGYRSSIDKLVGSPGTTLSEVTPNSGEVKIAGEVWTARSVDGVIPEGSAIEVYQIDGVTAVVFPSHLELP